MVSRLVKAMDALSQNDNDEPKTPNPTQERRKSARLNVRQKEEDDEHDDGDDTKNIHDSGTESDEEEMESIARHHTGAPPTYDPFMPWRNYDLFLTGGSPPILSSKPPLPKDVDTESWDSFGRESGIMTGDNDSDDGSATPTPNRRRMKDVRNFDDDNSSTGAEKRRHSDTLNDHPIAWRLRSFTTEPARPVKVAARRCPVRVIFNSFPNGSPINAAPEEEVAIPELGPAPAPKRNRRNSHRPSLDFDKMVETRIDPEIPSSSSTQQFVPQKPVTRSQINQ